MRRRLVAPAALAAALALPAAAPAATPFGANIEAAQPDASFVCGGPTPPFGAFTGSPTCTAYSAGRFGDGAGSHLVPSGFGVITRVDIRMPNATGPMQVTVLRSIRSAISTVPACCYHVGESQVFTPPAGQISSTPVRIPVKSELTPTNVFEYDAIALTALTPQTPIPAASGAGLSSGGYFPHIAAGQERFTGPASLGETQIMMRGIWEPDADRDGLGDETQDRCPGQAGGRGVVARAAQCAPAPGGSPGGGGGGGGAGGGGAPGAGAPQGGSGPGLSLARSSAAVRRGRASVQLTCGTAPCAGVLRLQSRRASKPRRRRTFGSARISLGAGATETVAVQLNKAGRRLLRRRANPKVWLNLAGANGLSRRITLAE